jgi:hypothetical protein
MKVLFKCLPLFVMGFFLFACKPKPKPVQNYFVSSNAHSLIDTYRDLVTQTNTDNCPYDNRPNNPHPDSIAYGDRYCTFSAMPSKGYRSGTRADEKGYVSFTSLYWYKHGNSVKTENTIHTIPFHTLWVDKFDLATNRVFPLCPKCYPNPVVLPDNLAVHYYQVYFVPVDSYKSSGLSQSTANIADDAITSTDPLVNIAIRANDIKKINDVFIENEGEYMSTLLPTEYKNTSSSIGVVCEVIRKDGTKVNCYIFNNIDKGFLRWKEKK